MIYFVTRDLYGRTIDRLTGFEEGTPVFASQGFAVFHSIAEAEKALNAVRESHNACNYVIRMDRRPLRCLPNTTTLEPSSADVARRSICTARHEDVKINLVGATFDLVSRHHLCIVHDKGYFQGSRVHEAVSPESTPAKSIMA